MKYSNVVILRPDGTPDAQGDSWAVDAKIEFRNDSIPVSVINQENVVGKATDFKNVDGVLICDIEVFSTEDFTHVEMNQLKPAPFGYVRKRNDKFEMKDVEIVAIVLTKLHADARIKTLGEQNAKN